MEAKQLSNETLGQTDFPSGLFNWAGYRSGGVKRPFHNGSGRPTGILVETPLTVRLRSWVDNLLKSPATAPTSVLLVGGPGNGKTDAVEVLIGYFGKLIGAEDRLVEELARIYNPTDGTLAPRKVILSLRSFSPNLPDGFPSQLHIVQDASEDPLQFGISRGKLLATEIRNCLLSPNDAIYICCANRGVVSEAITVAKIDPVFNDAVQVLDDLLNAVTSGPKDVPCWPLTTAPRIAAWPMDIESLTGLESDGKEPVFLSFINVATDEQRWPKTCPGGKICPFCTNRKQLSNDETKKGLAILLRYFELASGKRWTFRDLFSLIPHIIVGDDKEYATKSGSKNPCEWVHEQIKKQNKNSAETFKIKLDLASKLYQHRLFPNWPSFRTNQYKFAISDLSSLKKEPLSPAIGLFSWFGSRRRQVETDISRLLSSTWSETLDPALATGSINLIESKKLRFTIQEVEERFSLSVADGLEMVESQLSNLEKDILKELAKSDAFLTSQAYPRRMNTSAKLIQQVIRQFCCRLVKRSIGCRRGICKEMLQQKAFHDTTINSEGLKKFRKSLQSLLHNDKNRYVASLATTFGQPTPNKSKDVQIITSQVEVKIIPRMKMDSRPTDPVQYVSIGNYLIPITMDLFALLLDRDTGLRAASLTTAAFALFDTTRSIVTGEVSRDPKLREDGLFINIGSCRESFYLDGNDLSVILRGEENAN